MPLSFLVQLIHKLWYYKTAENKWWYGAKWLKTFTLYFRLILCSSFISSRITEIFNWVAKQKCLAGWKPIQKKKRKETISSVQFFNFGKLYKVHFERVDSRASTWNGSTLCHNYRLIYGYVRPNCCSEIDYEYLKERFWKQ